MIECPACEVKFKAKFRRPLPGTNTISCPSCGHLIERKKP